MTMLKIGLCGDDSNYCPRYLATQSGDEARLREVAIMWRMIGWWDAPSPGDLTCDGCATVSKCGLGIKECVLEKGVDNCGKCPDYPCEKLLAIFENNDKVAAVCRENFSAEDFELFRQAFLIKRARLDIIHREFGKNI